MKYLFALALASATIPLAASHAQQALVIGSEAGNVLRTGTEVPVRLLTELTTKNKALRVGQRFDVETTEPVVLDGRTVIPVGTPGVGEVTTVTNKGMWGKSGHFDVRMLYLRVGDRRIRLRGTADDKGVAGGAAAVAVSAIVFLPAGFFMTGTSALLPSGTIIKGFLDEDVQVAFAGATPAPIMTAPAGRAEEVVPARTDGASSPVVLASAPAGTVAAANIGPVKRPAKTKSGYCLEVPAGYAGTGSASSPMTSAAVPACSEMR